MKNKGLVDAFERLDFLEKKIEERTITRDEYREYIRLNKETGEEMAAVMGFNYI